MIACSEQYTRANDQGTICHYRTHFVVHFYFVARLLPWLRTLSCTTYLFGFRFCRVLNPDLA